MKKQILLLITSVLWVQGVHAASGIVNSPHDFSLQSWNVSGGRSGVCSPCHTAHHTDDDQIVPLWVHATTSSPGFVAYDSPTMDADAPTQPGGASKACLSCHDGTIAVNQVMDSGTSKLIGGSAVYIDPSAQIGPDLHTTHPISIDYKYGTGAGEDALLFPKTTTLQWVVGTLVGKTIETGLLINGKVECASCHDIHKQRGNAPNSGIMTVIGGTDTNGRGSTLCRNCHNK